MICGQSISPVSSSRYANAHIILPSALQEERLKTYKLFKEGSKRILVATDLVGRGIDIERVNIVINYDMPETDDQHGNGADTYLHRVRGGGEAGGWVLLGVQGSCVLTRVQFL